MIRGRVDFPNGMLVIALIASGLAAGVLAIAAPALGFLPLLAMVAAVPVVYLIRRPWTLFALYLFLLAPHVLLMALLLAHVGLPPAVVKAISAWKEATLGLFLVVALWRLQRSRGYATLPDLLMLAYLTLIAIHLAFSLLQEISLGTLLYGLRDHLLPFLLYFVGRSMSLSSVVAHQVYRWILVAALLFSVLGLIEWSVVPTEWHVEAGISRYYSEMLNLRYSAWHMGLPENYWRPAGDERLRRAVSIYGSSQSFALAFLLLLPASIYGLFTPALRERRLAVLTFVVSMAGLFATITRFTIVIGLGMLAGTVLISSRVARRIATWALASILVVLVVGAVVSPRAQTLISETLLFQDHSSSTRLQIWAETAEVIALQPLGHGIAEVGQTALRLSDAGSIALGIEGQLSKVGVELGLLGLLLYLAILLVLGLYLLMGQRKLSDIYARGLCFTAGMAALGMATNSLTTEWHNSISLVYPAWWLIGSCVSYVQAHANLHHRTVQSAGPSS